METFITEKPGNVYTYSIIKDKIRVFFGEKHGKPLDISSTGKASEHDIERAKNLLFEIVQSINPEVWASYWKHVGIAPILARLLSEPLQKNGFDIDAKTAEFLMWIHEIGKLVTLAYNRADIVQTRLFKDMGIPLSLLNQMPSISELVYSASRYQFTKEQLSFTQEPSMQQQAIVREDIARSISSGRLLEHILNVADNLGKTLPDDKDGTLLTLDSFRSYLRSQEERYAKSASSQPTDQTKTPKPRDWPSVAITMEHRRDGALLQFMRVQATIDWLQSPGVGINFGAVREKAQSLQPKIIIMVRHGELNPLSDDRVYNRDEHNARHNLPSMRLSESGVQQMQALNQTLRTRKYEVVFASASPERRAIESLAFLICGFVLSSPFKIDDRLDDTDSPGPIEDNMTMGQLQDLGGNIYNDDRNERPASIVSRMQEAFKEVINRLKPGQIGTFVTHGDPSAWLTHSILNEGVIPKPEELRKMYYLEKGQAQVFVIEHTGNVLFHFKIAPTTANKK